MDSVTILPCGRDFTEVDASYGMVDPGVPSLTVCELGAEGYRLADAVEGVDRLVLDRPFPVTVVPAVLAVPVG